MKHNITTKLKLTIYFCLFTFAVLVFTSCNTTEPPKPKPEKPKQIELKEITKSCTEIFIKVSTKDTLLPVNVVLQRDGKEITSFYQSKSDTTIIDTGLTAEQSYTYQAIIKNKGEEGKSKEIEISTLPTTSSNFTWEKYTFGEHSGSIINDVAIINENDIWAVGEIYMNDSSGNPAPHAYNAVHWDGKKWVLKRIMFYTICGQTHKTPYPASSIFKLNKNEIWVAMDGDQIGIIKNNVQTSTICLPFSFSIKELWGSSNQNVYIVGDNGNIVHYDGTSWTKIESGTNYFIHDIYGDDNPFTKETGILCCASLDNTKDSEIIRINSDLTTEKLDKNGLERAVDLWFRAGIRYYTIGNGLFEKRYSHNNIWKNLNKGRRITPNFMNGIDGNGLNDIIVSGSFGEILHYNGISWKSIKNEKTTLNNGSYFEVAIKGNLVVVVGYDAPKAIILMGRRD